MRLLAWILACALAAIRWRAFDDWRDRQRARKNRERMRHVIAALHGVALEENAAFDRLAAQCEREGQAQRAHVRTITPRLDKDVKRAA